MYAEDIRSQNEKYYYCSDYILSIKKMSLLFSVIYMIIVTALSLYINRLLMIKQFLIEAATCELGYEDVMDWVTIKLGAWWLHPASCMIICFNLLILIVIAIRLILLKSYALYKNKWIRKVPVIVYVLELFIIIFAHFSIDFVYGILILVVEFLPVILSSRLLYPLESRPGVDGYRELISFFFDSLAKVIINRL